MKKLLYLLFIGLSFSVQAQISTQKVNNTATIYRNDSPVTGNAPFFINSSLTVNGYSVLGTSTSIVTHSMTSSNAGNVVLTMRNADPTGLAGIAMKDAVGTDVAFSYFANNTSNIFIRNTIAGKSIKALVDGGLASLNIYQDVITNQHNLVVSGTNTVNSLEFTNGVNASVNLGFVQFKDKAATLAKYKFFADATRYISFDGPVPAIIADAGGGNQIFNIQSVQGPISLVPDAPDGSVKWAPTAVGIISEDYYIGSVNNHRSSNNRTQQYWADHTDPTIPAFIFLNSRTNVNSLLSIIAHSGITKFDLTTVTPGVAVFNIGNVISDSVVMNAGTMAIPNGFNIGSGQLNIPSSGSPTIGSQNIYLNTTVPAGSTSALPAVGTTFLAVNTNYLYVGSANLGGPGTNWVRIAVEQF